MTSPFEKFKLKDRDGVEREYVLRKHPADPGLEVCDHLLAMGLGPALSLLFEASEIPKNFGELDEAARADVLAKIRAKIDVQKIAAQVGEGIARNGGLRKLAPMLLAYTTRDGADLSERGVFDAAYAGNYAELTAACKRSFESNAFFEALSTLIG